jgi:hypothetical protein
MFIIKEIDLRYLCELFTSLSINILHNQVFKDETGSF